MDVRLNGTESPFIFRWPDQQEQYEVVWRYTVLDAPTGLRPGEVSIAVGWRTAFGTSRRRILVFRNEVQVLVEFVGIDAWETEHQVIWQLRAPGSKRSIRNLQDVPEEYREFDIGPADGWITGPNSRTGMAIRSSEYDHLRMIHVGLIRESHKTLADAKTEPWVLPETPQPTPSIPARSTEGSMARLTSRLLEYGRSIPLSALVPTLVPEAAETVVKDPFAFALAACLDRGTRAEIIWTIPHYLKQALGHLDPRRLALMSDADLASHLASMPHRPRYLGDAPRTIRELSTVVTSRYEGDASRLWNGRLASEVEASFRSIHGVGPGIASMVVVLLERTRGVTFSDLDHRGMDIKPDVHTTRVLFRLGASRGPDTRDAIEAARRLHPEYPGLLDTPLWMIGREWCRAREPECSHCPMNGECARVDVS